VFIDPNSLAQNLDRLEGIEKGTVRLVSQALYEFRGEAVQRFAEADDLPADIAEDTTRDALDSIGVSRINERLRGKIDYKRARFVFNKEYAVRQAMFVDSKAEKEAGTITIQTSQTSMKIQYIGKGGTVVDEQGTLPSVIGANPNSLLSTTVMVKYLYAEIGKVFSLSEIIVIGLPSGMLQAVYNPTPQDTIFQAGRHAPTLGEAFRTRVSIGNLKQKMPWRVQTIPAAGDFQWAE
jgi:hypothetical protein